MGDGTGIVKQEPSRVPMSVATMGDAEIDSLYRIAKALAMSGMFKDAQQAEQAFAKILIGRDLGLSPTQAMMGLHIVEGKPEIAAVTLAGFVQQSDGYDYRILEHDNEHCKIEFRVSDAAAWEDRELLGVSEFTIADAEKAGLTKPTRNGKPSNFLKFPRNMLYARAMSNGVRWFCPAVIRGIPVYHEGEIERVPNLSQGVGTGEPTGTPLPLEVVTVIERAKQLGHAGLADVGSVEMAVLGQPAKVVGRWVRSAHATLDSMPARGEDREPNDSAEPVDVEIVDDKMSPACMAPDPSRAGTVCELPDGHAGHHRAQGEGWDSFLPVDASQESDARLLEEKAVTLMDAAEAYRAQGLTDKADAREAEAEKLIAQAQGLSDPAQAKTEGTE